jgi:heme oxygenase
MLQEILKLATDQQHQNLEQMMFVDKIMNGTLSAEEYKEILQTNYIVHAVFEQQLFETLNPELKDELEINKRRKLPALLKDLDELNINPQDVEFQEKVVSVTANDATVLGAMYVLEGATLGGNVIVKRLKVNQNLQQLNLGFHYYQVYGEDLGKYWKQFCQVLNTKIPEEQYHRSINSALTMFEHFTAARKGDFTRQSIS